MNYGYNKNDVSERKIILESGWKQCLENLNAEMRGGYNNSIISGNNIVNEYIPDSRETFSESVEGLSLSLFPYFDDKMQTKYKEFEENIKKLYEKYGEEEIFIKEKEHSKFSIARLKLSKELFKELSCLLHRIGYLKSTSYIEGYDELIEEEGEEYKNE